jgi:hypothetical protein
MTILVGKIPFVVYIVPNFIQARLAQHPLICVDVGRLTFQAMGNVRNFQEIFG